MTRLKDGVMINLVAYVSKCKTWEHKLSNRNTMQRYIQQCPACGNYVEGREMRGIVRQMVHEGPGAVVEWVPVGGRLIWKGTKEVAKLLLRTNMDRWGDELERMLYKDIQVEYRCPNPACGRAWKETHQLSESEYRQWIDDVIKSAKSMVGRQDAGTKMPAEANRTKEDKPISIGEQRMGEPMRLQVPYSVVTDFVRERYQQEVTLRYVNESTVAVGKEVRMIISKNVSVNISVIQITGSDVTLGYEAGMGIDLIIKGVLTWFKDSFDGQADVLSDNKIQVHLDKIPQLEKVLKQIVLQGINFEEQYINVLFQITY